MFLHNGYRMSNSNSIIAFEADYAVFPALSFYAQLAMDELAMGFGEKVPGADDDAKPNAFAYMLGAGTAFPLVNGIFEGSTELVYTDPYMYLRLQDSKTGSGPRLDYVVANRYHSTPSEGVYYVENFLGYRWGGDAVVLNLNVKYNTFARWKAAANFMRMPHGTHDKWTAWSLVDNGDGQNDDSPIVEGIPTSSHGSKNFADANASVRDTLNFISALTLSGEYRLFARITAWGRIDLVSQSSSGNISANKAALDSQFTLGLSYMF
ncbi:MAG: hypothetical protein LBB68_11315 [Treponema sp.]|jgi:hypothetical protein|nr:hypothetical protein [Treponema sp.]